MFDEQPDGDLHGECAAEIHRLQGALADAYRALQNTLGAVPDGEFKRDMDDWLTAKLDAALPLPQSVPAQAAGGGEAAFEVWAKKGDVGMPGSFMWIAARKGWDAAASLAGGSQAEEPALTWVLLLQPGMSAQRKGPFRDGKHTEQMVRELYEHYPGCTCVVIDAPHTTYPTDGREWVSMFGDQRRKRIPSVRRCGHPLGRTSWCYDCELSSLHSVRSQEAETKKKENGNAQR